MKKRFALSVLVILFLVSCAKAPLRKENLESGPPQSSIVSSPQGSQTSQYAPLTAYLENVQELTDFLAARIQSHLPRRESSTTGFVVSVRDQAVYIDLAAKDGVQRGSELRVYREEEELRHPVTGQVLGIPKQDIGVLQVSRVEQNYSVASVLSVEKDKTIAVKDRVELLAGKNTLAILPFFSNSVILSSVDLTSLEMEVAEKLQASGAFEIIKGAEVERALKETGLKPNQTLDQKSIRELAGQLKVSYLLDGRIQQEGEKWVLISRLLSSADGVTVLEASRRLVFTEQLAAGRQPLELRATLKPEGPPPLAPQVQQAPEPKPAPLPSQIQGISEPKPEVFGASKQGPRGRGEMVEIGRSQVFSFGLHGLDVGDLYGDGRSQLILIGRNSVQIYALPQSFDGNQVELEEVYIDRGSSQALYLSIGVGDINKNGRDEIFVTNLAAGRLSSFVLEYSEGRFEPIAQNQNLFFRVLKGQNQPPQLVAQHFGTTRPFFGDLMVYEWRNNRYQASRNLSLPSKTDIYGSAWFGLGDGKDSEVLLLDEEDRLRFFRGRKLAWKSREFYGGSRLTFSKIRDQETADTVLQASPARDEFQDTWKISIKEKILTEDLDQDGVPEVILRKNIAPVRLVKNIVSYQKGQMVVLKWNGVSFQEQYATPVLDSYIVDYQVVPGEPAGSHLLAVGFNQDEGFFLPTQQSMVIFFKLEVY